MRKCATCPAELPDGCPGQQRFCGPCAARRHREWKHPTPYQGRASHTAQPLPTGARPERLPEASPDNRHLDCAHQGACLDRAAEGGWQGFRCSPDCTAHRPMTVEECRADIEPLADCLTVIMSSDANAGRTGGHTSPQRMAIRERRREAGLCILCGHRPAQPGKQGCSECYTRINERARRPAKGEMR